MTQEAIKMSMKAMEYCDGCKLARMAVDRELRYKKKFAKEDEQ